MSSFFARKDASSALELVLAAALWGFGFIALVWSLRAMGPLAITGWRFVIAGAVGFLIVFANRKLRASLTWRQFFLSAVPGLLLSATLLFQAWGLKYTSATKSGFITTLYVLFVPILEAFFLHRKIRRSHFVYVAIALVGTGLICDAQSLFAAGGSFGRGTGSGTGAGSPLGSLNIGDLLTLICALIAGVQILWFALIADKIGSAFVFNCFQSVWAASIPLALSFVLEPAPQLGSFGFPWIGLLMLAFGSTLIGFALQVHAQKRISPSLASLIYLLESPFAALFAIYFLGEHLRALQWIGGAMILLAAALSTAFAIE